MSEFWHGTRMRFNKKLAHAVVEQAIESLLLSVGEICSEEILTPYEAIILLASFQR
jgi:hypothetical protein